MWVLIADTDPNDSTKTVPAPYNAGTRLGRIVGRPAGRWSTASRMMRKSSKRRTCRRCCRSIFVTTSASGLHPDITPAAVEFQVPRVPKARKLSPDKVRTLVAKMTQDRFVGILGEKRISVLKLNMALDALADSHASMEDAAFEAGIQ